MSEDKRYIVFDIGGTSVKSALVDSDGRISRKKVTPTPADYRGLLDLMHADIRSYPHPTAAVCAIPGVYDRLNDKVLFTPNIKYLPEQSLAADIVCDVPVFVENDANMAALGEYYYGFDTPPESLVFLTLGTGVGGGLVVDGKIPSTRMSSMEPGHMTLVAEGRLCGCGKRGCFEQYCSLSAITKDYMDTCGDKTPITVNEIADKISQGNFAAYAAFDLFSLNLAHGISSLIDIFTPEVLRLGGGLCELHDYFFPRTRELLKGLTFPAYRGVTDVQIAKLRNDAALVGGAKWAEYLLG